MTLSTSRYLSISLVALAVASLSGCSRPDTTDCFEGLPPAPEALVVITGTHAGASQPDLTAPASSLVAATLAAGNPVQVIVVDGSAHQVAVDTPPISNKTCGGLKATVTTATNTIGDTIRAAQASSDGNNLYAAVSMAADLTRSNQWQQPLIIIQDSGLSETGGPIDFSRPGMTTAAPDEVASYVKRTQPVDLTGMRFLLIGFGQTTAPQTPLSPTERDRVTAIWKATLNSLGAETDALPTPRTATGPSTPWTTKPVPTMPISTFDPPTPANPATTVVFTEDQVQFQPDSTSLVDPDSAHKALIPVIEWLAADSARSITITGTTSSAGTEAGRLALSRDRATTIQSLIQASDERIHDRQITVVGVGTHFYDYVPDRTPNGDLDPAAAATNRTVRITATQ